MTSKPLIEVPTRFGTLEATPYLDNTFPGIWVTLRLPNGCSVDLAVIECMENDMPSAELRTVVYGVEEEQEPTEILTHILMTPEEREEMYVSQ